MDFCVPGVSIVVVVVADIVPIKQPAGKLHVAPVQMVELHEAQLQVQPNVHITVPFEQGLGQWLRFSRI